MDLSGAGVGEAQPAAEPEQLRGLEPNAADGFRGGQRGLQCPAATGSGVRLRGPEWYGDARPRLPSLFQNGDAVALVSCFQL